MNSHREDLVFTLKRASGRDVEADIAALPEEFQVRMAQLVLRGVTFFATQHINRWWNANDPQGNYIQRSGSMSLKRCINNVWNDMYER